jgi:hypothetical protein
MGVELTALLATAAPYLSAASMTIGAASAVTGYMAQSQQAKAQEQANAVTAQNALTARNNQHAQLTARALQERDAASERMFESRVEALEGSSAAEAQSAARGVQGNTIDALAREYYSKQGRAEAAIQRTNSNTLQQLRAENEGAQATYESRLASMPSARRPSLWGLGLGIGSSVAQTAAGYAREERMAIAASKRGS